MKVYTLPAFLFVTVASFSQTVVRRESPDDFLKN